MAIGIDDLYDDDDVKVDQIDSNQSSDDNQNNDQNNDDDFMSDFLKSKGISDPERIKFDDGSGNIQEISWNDLSREEQINILNTPVNSTYETQPDSELTEDEIKFINQLRSSNLTPQQYIELIQNQTSSQEPVYKVDDLDDDSLYLLDLESRVGELTDEQAIQALTKAKEDEDFYKKQVDGIRKEYKEREDFLSNQEKAEIEEQQRQEFQNYSNNIVNAIEQFNSIGNLDLNLENEDKTELAAFMLDNDTDGINYLQKALQDPQTLVKAAWFVLNGDDAFDSISDYFINQIKTVSENQYKKGFEDGKKGVSPKPGIVINTKKSNPQTIKEKVSIDDLYDED